MFHRVFRCGEVGAQIRPALGADIFRIDLGAEQVDILHDAAEGQ